MRIVRTIVIICSTCFLAAMPFHLGAQSKPAAKTCQAFVQQFYDWYVPIALKEDPKESSWKRALRERASWFDGELSNRLKEEDAIQAKVHDAGLDADPFLNSQDPARVYVVAGVRRVRDKCWADVYGVYSGKRSKKPEVSPELKRVGDEWIFLNFHFANSDLLTLLKALRKRQGIPPSKDGGGNPVRPGPK